MKIEVAGTEKLKAKIAKLQAISMSNAVRKGALKVERDAKIIVPVDTGNLRRSITHQVEGNQAIVGTSVEYAAKVELGIGQRRQPYLTPALNLNRTLIKQYIIDEMNRQMEAIAR